jgi:hypothetical protein
VKLHEAIDAVLTGGNPGVALPSRVGPTRVAVNARIVGWTLTSDFVLAVWRRSG